MADEIVLNDAKNFQTILDVFKVSKNSFANKIAYKSSISIYNVLSGDRPITEDMMRKIVHVYPEVNYSFLELGTGVPLKEGYKEQLHENLLSIQCQYKNDKLDEILRRLALIEKILFLSLDQK